MIRALEFHHDTGEKISAHNEEARRKESPYDAVFFCLYRERQELYRRIDERVDRMMEQGLYDEVKRLIEYGCTPEMTSMQGLGYRQLYRLFLGQCSVDEAVEAIKRETRHFAKRQMTWFRRERNVRFLDVDKENFFDVYGNGDQ